jgi:cytochrome P450 family 142 subfamily A polypeptide 1
LTYGTIACEVTAAAAAITLNGPEQPNPHIAFGFGPHFCLGAARPRLELRVLFEEAIRRLPEFELVGSDLLYRESDFISGLEAMPVRFTPTPPEAAS